MGVARRRAEWGWIEDVLALVKHLLEMNLNDLLRAHTEYLKGNVLEKLGPVGRCGSKNNNILLFGSHSWLLQSWVVVACL